MVSSFVHQCFVWGEIFIQGTTSLVVMLIASNSKSVASSIFLAMSSGFLSNVSRLARLLLSASMYSSQLTVL